MYEDAHLESQYEDANGGTVDLDDDYGAVDDEDGGCVIRRTSLGGGTICAECGPSCDCVVCDN